MERLFLLKKNILDLMMSDIWSPTYKLRYFYKSVDLEDIFYTERVLQQMWINDKGKEEWRDIPIVTE